jgi:hypothetical protein
MLIRRELEAMMVEITEKMDELTRIVTDTRRLEDLEARVDENEKYARENITQSKKDIYQIMSGMKIQQLMIQAVPKPKAADDEEYPAYENFHQMVKIGEAKFRGDMADEAEKFKKKWCR